MHYILCLLLLYISCNYSFYHHVFERHLNLIDSWFEVSHFKKFIWPAQMMLFLECLGARWLIWNSANGSLCLQTRVPNPCMFRSWSRFVNIKKYCGVWLFFPRILSNYIASLCFVCMWASFCVHVKMIRITRFLVTLHHGAAPDLAHGYPSFCLHVFHIWHTATVRVLGESTTVLVAQPINSHQAAVRHCQGLITVRWDILGFGVWSLSNKFFSQQVTSGLP